MKVFQLTLDQAIRFWSVCQELGLETEQERVVLLEAMAKEKQAERVWTTGRSQEEFIKDLAKQYSVLRVTKRDHYT